MILDKDLMTIQEVRNLVRKAAEAQELLAVMSQEQIDRIVKAMADAGAEAAEEVAKMAVEETEIGRYEDKIIKNLLATKVLYDEIKDMKTVGLISEDQEKKVYEIAEPVGVVAAVTPTTNPTSTAMNNAIISIKARNAIVFSPHPRARKCTVKCLEILRKAAVNAGAPDDCIGCIAEPSIPATNELMKNDGVSMILATGGPGIVKAAYSSGKPALGVGAGNAPSFIERTADIEKAVRNIVTGKTFDNGTICASEQSVICERFKEKEVREHFKANGAYFLSDDERTKVEKILLSPKNTMLASSVGRSALQLAKMAGISVPEGTKLLIGDVEGVGEGYPLSHEKLSTVLAFYVVDNWEEGCKLARKLLVLGGLGHTMSMHTEDKDVALKFALEKPAMRILVNTPSSFGGVGATTGLFPALSLGCGTDGGNIVSDNLGPQNLLNIKRMAYGIKEADSVCEDLLKNREAPVKEGGKKKEPSREEGYVQNDNELVDRIVMEVVKKLQS